MLTPVRIMAWMAHGSSILVHRRLGAIVEDRLPVEICRHLFVASHIEVPSHVTTINHVTCKFTLRLINTHQYTIPTKNPPPIVFPMRAGIMLFQM